MRSRCGEVMSEVSLNLPSKLDVCIFHDPCSDGFTSAWSVYRRYGKDVEFLPGSHEKNKGSFDYWMEKLKDKHVLVCDFSFGREMTEKLHAAAASYHVLDHHVTSREALGDLPYCYFDMARSGALITWETLHPGKPVPNLVKYVSDRDIWQNALPDTQEINTVIHRKEHTFDNWNELDKKLEDTSLFSYTQVVRSGTAMLEYQAGLVRDIAARAVIWKIAGVDFLTVNCPCIASEVCDVLRHSFDGPVASYEVQGDVVKLSLRSIGDYSVGDIAKQFAGGGGHKNAAGFAMPIGKVDWVNRRLDP